MSPFPRTYRPPVSDLTARTLRRAHALATNLRLIGSPLPPWLALLEQDYEAWRKRVQLGAQPETVIRRRRQG